MYVVDMTSAGGQLAQYDLEIVLNSWQPTQVDPNTPFTVTYQVHNKSANTWTAWGYLAYDDAGSYQVPNSAWTSPTPLGPNGSGSDYYTSPGTAFSGIQNALTLWIFIGHLEVLCYQCDPVTGLLVSQVFNGDTCPTGWQSTPPTCAGPQITCYRCDPVTGLLDNQVFDGDTCPTGWQSTPPTCAGNVVNTTIEGPVGAGEVTGGNKGYLPGDFVQLTAITNPGYMFTGWTGYINSNVNPLTFWMPSQNVTEVAHFSAGGLPIDIKWIIIGGTVIGVAIIAGVVLSKKRK